jgi:hypothetical protein
MSTFLTRDKAAWSWTMMIMQPDWITREMFAAAVEKAGREARRTAREPAARAL